MYLPVPIRRYWRCNRCDLKNPRRYAHCRHCHELDDGEVDRLRARHARQLEANREIGLWLGVAALLIAFALLMLT